MNEEVAKTNQNTVKRHIVYRHKKNSLERLAAIKAKYANGVTTEILAEWIWR